MGLKTNPKIYKYHDGSGNTYIVKKEDKAIIEYIPIKPSFSSSGVYDGGSHIKKEINESLYNKISLTLEAALTNKESHINNRVKMSGLIVIKVKQEENSCILAPNSKEIIKIEEILKEIIN